MTQPANAAKEIVYAVQESALGTTMTSPTYGTNAFYPPLTDGMFTMDSESAIEFMDYGGGIAIHADAIADSYACKGTLKTKCYPSEFAFWFGLFGVRINTAGTLPWPTTELPGDLASIAMYHAVRPVTSDTYLFEKFTGIKGLNLTLEVSRKTAAAMLTMDFIACRQYPNAMTTDVAPTDFVFPTDAQYSTGPFTFSQTGGLLSIGSTRTQYSSLTLSIKNTLDPQWWETPYLQTLQFTGREVTLEADLMLKASPADKATYQALTPTAASLSFLNATKTYVIGLNGQSRITKVPYVLDGKEQFKRKLTLTNLYDGTAGTDLSFTFP